MSCENRFHAELHERGLRITPQREAILSVLHRFGTPVTAEQVYRKSIELNPAIELSTVYRTLELLQSIGLVSAVGQEGKQRRFLHVGQEKPHFHLRCQQCGKVEGIDLMEIASFASRLRSKHGFVMEAGHVTLPGLCKDCR
jgi:Fur family ferric uptake transcriptional regulator